MVVVPRDRRRRYGFFYAHEGDFVDSEWDEIGVDAVLAACRHSIELHGVINLHPDGYASAQLQTPLICRPGNDTGRHWRPLLPQIGERYNFDWGPTPGHWAARRRERDRLKNLPPEQEPAEPPPPPRPPRILRTNGGGWVVTSPPQPLPQPTVTFAPGPAHARTNSHTQTNARKISPTPIAPEPEEPPLPAIEAPTLESALREFYRLYEGHGLSARTKALYRSTVLKFLPGYQFPAHLR
jgi:hypothetical protein